MALGQQLREARERQGLTTSQVAAATRMKMQIVEAIEREDFGKIAAPIYGKGFIKLYAELVGADPRPLLREYVERLSDAAKTPSLVSEGTGKRPVVEPIHAGVAPLHPDESHVQLTSRENVETPAPSTPAGDEEMDLFSHAARAKPAAPSSAGTPPPPEEIEPAPSTPPPPVARGEPEVTLGDRLSEMNLWQSPIRAASLVIGLVLLILLVISTLSRCVVSPKHAQGSAHRAELQVVVQPPEPYFE